MFLGAISIIVHLIQSAIDDYEIGKRNRIGMENANERLGIWYDYKGRTRLLANNHLAQWHRKDGDDIITDVEVWPWVEYNISEYERCVAFEKQRLIDDGKTVVEWGHQKHRHPYNGKWVKDKATGNMYCIMKINWNYWYVNPSDGKIVRQTDGQLEVNRGVLEALECGHSLYNTSVDSILWGYLHADLYMSEKANEYIEKYNSGAIEDRASAQEQDVWRTKFVMKHGGQK